MLWLEWPGRVQAAVRVCAWLSWVVYDSGLLSCPGHVLVVKMCVAHANGVHLPPDARILGFSSGHLVPS